MIPSTLRIVLLVGVLAYFIVILLFLKDKALELKYTLLWIGAGAFMLLLVARLDTRYNDFQVYTIYPQNKLHLLQAYYDQENHN